MICKNMFQVYFESIKNLIMKYTSIWTCSRNCVQKRSEEVAICKHLRFLNFSHTFTNSEVYLKCIFNIDVFILKLQTFNIDVFILKFRDILGLEFWYCCIYCQIQRYIWKRLSKLMYLFIYLFILCLLLTALQLNIYTHKKKD